MHWGPGGTEASGKKKAGGLFGRLRRVRALSAAEKVKDIGLLLEAQTFMLIASGCHHQIILFPHFGQVAHGKSNFPSIQ